MTFYPGTRVKVFDSSLYIDDVKTPLSMTMKPATVVKWYGESKEGIDGAPVRRYEDMIDVIFDHKPERISEGHFATVGTAQFAQPL